MTKKTRLTILFVCIICFLVIAPVLVAYSMGYRFDFENLEITSTGGIYIRTFPPAKTITIDSKISGKPGIFSNAFFIQSLLPKDHTVKITKDGYFDYFKTLPVSENKVTKLENVLLFREDIRFEIVADQTKSPFIRNDMFVIKKTNLYYSDIEENKTLTAAQKSTPLIKGVIAFAPQNNTIIWLSSDGILYKSAVENLDANPEKLTLTPIKLAKTDVYKIITNSDNIFLIGRGNLLLLDRQKKELYKFAEGAKDANISPDGRNIVYFSGKQLRVSPISIAPDQEPFLYNSPESVTDCVWLNNDYIIISMADRIIISEIDSRGNINTVTLPQTITLAEEIIKIKNPQIFFSRQDGKLYILTDGILLSSEKITQ